MDEKEMKKLDEESNTMILELFEFDKGDEIVLTKEDLLDMLPLIKMIVMSQVVAEMSKKIEDMDV